MADQGSLPEILRRFARTLTGRYDLTDVLYELCDNVVAVLAADGAGVSVFNDGGDLRFVTATDETVVQAEKAQEEFGRGPCISSVALGRPVPVRDIRDHDEWPDYRTRAEALGLYAVLGLPLVLDGDRIGSMDVYSYEPREWSDAQVAEGEVLADIAAAYVLNASELAKSRRTAEQLQAALDSRVVIEQAKGRLAGELGVSVNDAFDRLRSFARSSNRSLRSVASEVIEKGPDALL
jgi:GAF domain-containing protein